MTALPSTITIGLLALCVAGGPALSATYHLAPGGDDAGPGSAEQPWATLEHACAQVAPGDTVVLAPGEYAGELRLVRSGEAGAPIVFRAAERHQAVLTGPEDGYTAVLQEVAHIRIEGLAFPSGSELRRWISLERAESVALDDLMMTGPAPGNALQLLDCSNVRLTDCTMLGGISGNLVYVTESDRIVFEGCEISGSAHALLLFLPDRTNRQVVIRGCFFAGQTGRTLLIDSVDQILFENNVIARTLDGGRSADSRFGFFVTNSIFRGSRVFDNWGSRLFAISPYRDTLDFSGVRVYANVFDGNTSDAVTVSGHANVRDAVFANNVFAANDPFGSQRQIVVAEGNTAENVRFISNLIEGNVQVAKELTAADAETQTGIFERTLAAAPGFTRPEVWEHVPAEDSPLIDAGAFLTRAVADGEGTRLEVADARWFFDGFGIEGERGDLIAVGDADRVARIVSADYAANVLELDRPLQWSEGDAVSLPWAGDAPDIGVAERDAGALAPPVVVAEPPVAAPGKPVVLRAVMPGSAQPVSVQWLLSDGTRLEGAQVEHAFAEEGEFGARVRVTGADGEVARSAGLVVVEEPRAAGEPLLHSTFDDSDAEWGWRWQTYRPGNGMWEVAETDEGPALHVTARDARADMPCRTNPRGWEIDRDPLITVRYRISPGAVVGAYVEAFPSAEGTRRLWLAGTEAALPLPGEPADAQGLIDDGQWHTLRLDARALRERWPDVTMAQRFAFEGQWQTGRDRISAGDEFWLAEVTIGPAQQ
jgi:hypothetical protein